MLDTGLLTKLEGIRPIAQAWRTGAIGVEESVLGDSICGNDLLTVRYVLNPAVKRNESGNLLEVSTGMGWLSPAGCQIRCAYESRVRSLALQLPDATLREVMPEGAQAPALDLALLRDPAILQMILNLYDASQADDAYAALYRDTMTLALAAHLIRMHAAPEPADCVSMTDPRLRRAMDYMEDNLASPISLDELAGVAAMSRYHFAKTFKDATGLPPHRYLAEKRIDRARHLLASSGLPTAEIGYQVGYPSQSNFTAVFRRLTGLTPARYRQALS